ncbi:MAG TPA: LemA family protein, partial [Blastocatellia bacterium]
MPDIYQLLIGEAGKARLRLSPPAASRLALASEACVKDLMRHARQACCPAECTPARAIFSAFLTELSKDLDKMRGKTGLWIGGAVLVLLIIFGLSLSGTYNSLVQLDQATQAQWAQVENVYQRRADLVPNLVETVKGASNFE